MTMHSGNGPKWRAWRCRKWNWTNRAGVFIVIRQRVAQRPQAGGKTLLEVPGYRFQALVTNLPRSVDALNVWRQYNGRADLENRIKELGEQFGIKRLCVDNFWGTEAMHHLAIAAYNLCVLLQRRLGQLEKCGIEHATLALVWPGGGVEPGTGQAHAQTSRAWSGSSNLVARNPHQTHGFAELQCS